MKTRVSFSFALMHEGRRTDGGIAAAAATLRTVCSVDHTVPLHVHFHFPLPIFLHNTVPSPPERFSKVLRISLRNVSLSGFKNRLHFSGPSRNLGKTLLTD